MKLKRIICLVLAAFMACTAFCFPALADEPEPVLRYDFESVQSSPSLYGNAQLAFDDLRLSNVLSLDGSSGTYAELPQGFFDGKDVMTVMFDVLPRQNGGNYFTFTFGKDNEKYNFFRIRDNEIRNAITVYSYPNEHEVRCLQNNLSRWMHIAIVFNSKVMRLYVDSEMTAENTNTEITVSSLGTDLISYIGKSFYDGDGFFNGSFDNFEVYDTALGSAAIAEKAQNDFVLSPALRYTFEDGTDMPQLYGNAQAVYDTERKSKVLSLDGSNNTYAAIPQGFFDGKNVMTVLMDVKAVSNSGNYFTFAFGKDNSKYNFLRIRGSEVRNAITVESYMNEREVKTNVDFGTGWMSLALVFNGTYCALYVNGTLASVNNNTGLTVSDLGSSLLGYIGKSFYDGDGYFNGLFDNIEIYDSLISDTMIYQKALAHLPLLVGINVGKTVNIDGVSGTDNHTSVKTVVDRSSGNINSIIKRSQNIKAVPVNFSVLNSECTVLVDGIDYGTSPVLDLSYERSVVVSCGDRVETYTLKVPEIANNSVLPGMYADPDIDILDGKFWIYPTTDGTPGWGGSEFHAFSSRDMVHWCDEGVILDNKNKNPGLNEKGIQIASSAWSDGNAWAPAVEAKNGKYYFYYCGRILSSLESQYGEGMAIGVAVADNPQGPYTAGNAPILYPKMLQNANIGFAGQVIDPSVYTENGTSYLLFGNGSAAMVTLNSDMTSVNTSTFYLISGLNDFRESIAVFKRGNYYYFHWSCDDTGSENYHIKYGTASSLKGKITNQGVLLEKDADNGILATGHQSIVQAGSRFFIAYHRFYTPLSIGGNVGHRRETCIEELTFKNKIVGADTINAVTPSYSGVGPVDVNGNDLTENTVYPTCIQNGSITGSLTMTADEAQELRAIGHIYLKSVQTPSCTQDGFDKYTCTVCGETFSENYIPASGHDFKVTRHGENTFSINCNICGTEKEVTFPENLNSKTPDIDYDSDIDRNSDGVINAKDYAILLKESEE